MILPIDLAQSFLQSVDLLVLFVNSLLVWSFHLCNQFDPDHVFVQVGDHFYLKIVKLQLFLVDKVFQLLYVGSHIAYVLLVLGYVKLMFLHEFSVFLI